jgi:DNA-binding MarR family transcriptional regulator
MSSTNLQDNLNWLIIRSSMVAKQRLMKLSDEHDLSPMQALTLCSLEPEQAVPMSVIADFFTCDPSNVTGIVERLQQGALIERRESSIDRRVKTIQLTETGIQLRQTLLEGISEEGAANLEQLTSAEVAMLKQLLSKTIPAPDLSKHPACFKA